VLGSCDPAHRGHAALPVLGGLRRSEVEVEEGSDQPGGDAYVYALTNEVAYLQTDDDEKPAGILEPPPDPAQAKCWFCRKPHQQVQTLFGAEYPVRDPNNFANETLIFICNECVTKFAESLAKKAPAPPQ
jgi:ClpX C4-type zinc finger